MSIYFSYDEQRKQDATFTVKSMGIQLGINLGTAIVTMIGFSILRPRNTLVYAPRSKFSKKGKQPPLIGSQGYFSWIKPLLKVTDEELLDQVGCDALIDWPPASGSIEILSLAGINYVNGKTRADVNTVWYWSPFVATYLFSILIAYFMYRASCDYIDMRQYWFRLPENEVTMKSLMVSPVPKEMRSDGKLKTWVESTQMIQYPIKESMIGYHSSKLSDLFEKHKEAVHRLESTLASYLSDGKNTDTKKRPLIRIGGFLCLGGRKVDAIEHYTKEVADLEKEISELRYGKKEKAKVAPYGWISFDRIEWAHQAERSLEHQKSFHVRLSPTPQDLLWPNLPLDDKARKAKRMTGHILYWIFVFAWMIPMSALSATSNIINLIRLIPSSANFIENHQIIMGLIQSYFTPVVMAIFFYLLPIFFRFLSQQQGYWTKTTLDRKVLVKLYIFFIINNLLVFTLTSMFIGIYGQLKGLVQSGATEEVSLVDYIMQLAKNISQVSTFWINYVCLHSLGLTMELAMILPLITITLRKFFTRPSPAELRELARPPEFDYPKNYNLLLFFFTISLIYSAMSPFILPFACLYFCVASMVYKYLLVYVYETRMESGGKIWPVLFQTIMTSTIFFQLIMILILVFKGGNLQAYLLIPLPVFTLIYQYFYYRRMHIHGSYIFGTHSKLPLPQHALSTEKTKAEPAKTLKSQFQDPAYHQKLSTPTVHDDVKHLLPKVYHSIRQGSEHLRHDTIEMTHQYSKRMMHNMDLDSRKGFNHHQHDVVVIDEGINIKFEPVTEQEIVESEDYQEESHDDLTRQMSVENTPLLLAPQPPPVSKMNRNITSEYIEMYTSFTPNPSAVNVLDEEEDEEEDEEDGASSLAHMYASLIDLSTNDAPTRRHTLPLPTKQVSSERRLSLPSIKSERESIDDSFGITVPLPAATTSVTTTRMTRSHTLPPTYRPFRVQEQIENPFEQDNHVIAEESFISYRRPRPRRVSYHQ
ncbi:hypothetical protein CU097_004541 [Rhizopus azygosporus]|uniref:DUF221-domain-containing protein n=1 Tax=Rhizopus azygosporus TaxID=86630 RepID=A0A367JIG3_RHIAZ|nr:hypothetical protein CU097_004541 [Rhizopus azygosporus]